MLTSERLRTFTFLLLLAVAGSLCVAPRAHALGELPIGLDPNSLVSDDIVNAVVGLIGIGFQHRPYEPATPLGLMVGMDLSVEATLVKIPDSFFATLAANGAGSASAPIPSLPMARLHLHKGFGEFVDLGGSALVILGNKILGGDAKVVFLQGEEGPTYAFRFCYTYVDLSFSGVNVSTKTYAPQLLMSRQMDFADPFLGVGLEYSTGALDGSRTPDAPAGVVLPPGVTMPTVTIHKTGIAYGGQVFGGVSLRIPRSGLRMTIEGSYNTAGTSTLGLKSGFTF